jgi:hypothetical protein
MADKKNLMRKNEDGDYEYDTPGRSPMEATKALPEDLSRGFNAIRKMLREPEEESTESQTASFYNSKPDITKIKIRPSRTVTREETGEQYQASGDEGPEYRPSDL